MESKRFLISQGRELQYYLFGHESKTLAGGQRDHQDRHRE